MNKVFLIGNLTRDPELTETSAGMQVCRFTIAVNRNYTQGGERQTDFFNCTAWRGTAENVARYCQKGSKVAVSGSVELRSYENSNGEQVRTVNINCADIEFLTPKREDDDREQMQMPATQGAGSRNGRPKPQLQSFDDDGDIPF